MERVIFPKGQQEIWIDKLLKRSNLNAKSFAVNIGVHPRTFSDWKRGKISLPLDVLNILISKFSVKTPENIQIVPQYWYVHKGARKGALRRMELYGPVGTPEGRRKGGKVSQQRRRENPEYYRLLGCNVKKEFNLGKTESFAETTGIILGDGGITNYQVNISLGSKVDREYAYFVRELFLKVFGESPAWHEYKDNVIVLQNSGIGLVDKLVSFGLKRGNKIYQQVHFPEWIWEHINFQIACVRGLMDTDGSFYSYRPTNRKKGENFALCFTSYSQPLLLDVSKVLDNLKIKHTFGKNRLNIYSINAINEYYYFIGSNNPKHKNKFVKYFETRKS